MKFKTNHSPGHWFVANRAHLISGNTEIAIFHKDDDWEKEQNANISAITQVPAMLEYMMDRADFLSRFTHIASYAWELKTLLAILKNAGVEVVE